MKEIDFRLLRADEIEVRPAMVKDGKATMLLYIDSRAVVRLMNELCFYYKKNVLQILF